MSPRTKTVLTLTGSLLLGGGLLWLALRGADLRAVAVALREAAWGWLVPLTALSVASVWLRAWRWRLLLDALGPRDTDRADAPAPTTGLAFRSTLIGYLVNYAAPRVGELARAANVARSSRPGFAAVIGTVVVERIVDVIVLLLALGSVVVLYGDRLIDVLGHFSAGLRSVVSANPVAVVALAAAGLVAGLGVVALVRLAVRRSGADGRLADLLRQFRDGLRAALRVERPLAFAALTLALWGCYALMAYVPLRMLGLTEAYGLGLVDAWALMTVGAVGMALPSPGGAGSYHYATVATLTLLFGVAASPAATYAVLGHAAQLVFYATAGVVALLAQGTSWRAVTQVPAAESAPPQSSPPVAPAAEIPASLPA